MVLLKFLYGIPLFMIVVALLALITLWDHNCMCYTASIVTAEVVSLKFWFASTQRKWGDFLMTSKAQITNQSFDKITWERR